MLCPINVVASGEPDISVQRVREKNVISNPVWLNTVVAQKNGWRLMRTFVIPIYGWLFLVTTIKNDTMHITFFLTRFGGVIHWQFKWRHKCIQIHMTKCRVIFSNKKDRKKVRTNRLLCDSVKVFSVCVCVWWIKSVNLGLACATKIIERAPRECIGKRLLAIGFSCTPKVSTLFEWCVSVCVF